MPPCGHCLILHRALGAHKEVVSCHSDTPLWRYVALPVLNQICRKLLFNNLNILRTIEILLITFCQEGPQMLCGKFQANQWNRLGGVRKRGFRHFANLRKKIPLPLDSAQFTERIDKRFLNVRQSIWVISKNALSLIIVPRSGGNSQQQQIILLLLLLLLLLFVARCDLYSNFGEFWGMPRLWKMW